MYNAIFQNHNDEVKALIRKDFAAATHVRYETSLKHTVNFIKLKYKVFDINIRKIEHEFITSYELYLKSACDCCQNKTLKYIMNFGKIIRICLVNGWIQKNPFTNYKSRWLKLIELFYPMIKLKRCSINSLQKTVLISLKIFLFSCFTGLAYAHVKG